MLQVKNLSITTIVQSTCINIYMIHKIQVHVNCTLSVFHIKSDILTVQLHDIHNNSELVQNYFYLVQLWSMNNYHWYLKQSIPFEEDRVSSLTWDPEHVYRLHVLCNSGKYLQCTWHWATHSSNNALVAVIDGSKNYILSV